MDIEYSSRGMAYLRNLERRKVLQIEESPFGELPSIDMRLFSEEKRDSALGKLDLIDRYMHLPIIAVNLRRSRLNDWRNDLRDRSPEAYEVLNNSALAGSSIYSFYPGLFKIPEFYTGPAKDDLETACSDLTFKAVEYNGLEIPDKVAKVRDIRDKLETIWLIMATDKVKEETPKLQAA